MAKGKLTKSEKLRAILRDPVSILFFHGARLALLALILVLALLTFNLERLLRGRVAVSVDEASLFISTISQAIAALSGLLIAFYFFAMQDLVRRRDEAFWLFKQEMNRFLELATERPVELAPFDQHMNRIIYSFSLVSLEDCEFPSNPSMSSLNWHEATKGMTEAFDVHWEQLDRHARWYLQQLMAALLHAENGLSNLGIYWVGIVVMRRIVLDIREIFALLAISLVVLWTLSAGIPSSIEGDLLTPISFTAAAWITLILISLSENVRILYRDLSFPWKIDL